jgi:hypothetical protein
MRCRDLCHHAGFRRCGRTDLRSDMVRLWFAFFFVLPALEAGARLIGDYVMNAAAVLAKVIGEHGFVAAAVGGRKPVVNSIAWANSVSLTSSVFRVTRSLKFQMSSLRSLLRFYL